jgi:hypothetical protein
MRDFVGHEVNCFGLAPKTRFSQPKDQLAAKAPKHRLFLVGEIPVFGRASKTRFSQPKDKLAAKAPKHQ